MFILIDGFWGSGKTVLRSLLDGHKDLYVSPSQESIFSSFYRNINKSNFFLYKDVRLIREYLIDSYYYNLEYENHNGFPDSDFKKKKINFNFYKFEEFWIKELCKKKKWNNKIILEIIYSSIIKFFYDTKKLPLNEKKVFIEDNAFYSHKFYLETFPDAKLIITERTTSDLIASLVNRKVNTKDYYTDGYKNYNFNYLVRKKNYPLTINENYKITRKLKEKFSDRVYICNFEQLIFNTKYEMLKISEFLDIKFNRILEKPTHFGSSLFFKDGDRVLKVIKYSSGKIFSNYQNNLLLFFEKKFLLYKIFSFTFFDYIYCLLVYFLRKIYHKIKYILLKFYQKLFFL